GSGSTIGGFVGINEAGVTLTRTHWDTTTSGTATRGGSNSGTRTPTGLTTAQMASALPAGVDPRVWGNVRHQTTPYLIGTPGPVYVGSDTFLSTLVFNISQLQAINSNLSGDYALAQNIDATGVTGFVPIGAGATPYSGNFNGLGNTISNLTISD